MILHPPRARGQADSGQLGSEDPGIVGAIARPALHLDTSARDPLPLVRQAIDSRPRLLWSLVVVGSYAKAEEAAEDLGRGARAYPRRTPLTEATPGGNCKNHEEAKRAEAAGLPVGLAVCSTCEYRKECRYLRERDRALAAPVLVAPAAVVLPDPLASMAEREVMFLLGDGHLDSPDFFKPVRVAEGGHHLRGLAALRTALLNAEEAAILRGVARLSIVQPSAEGRQDVAFWQHLIGLVDRLSERLAAIGSSPWQSLALTPCTATPPPGWAASLWHWLRGQDAKPGKELLRLLVAAVLGQVREVQGTASRLVGLGETVLPVNKPAIVFDATITPDGLARLSGRAVFSLDVPEQVSIKALQVAEWMMPCRAPSVAAGFILAYHAALPGQRVGVLCHLGEWPGIKAELKRAGLRKVARGFWRGDLSRLGECDLVVAVGQPAFPPEAISKRLVRQGMAEAAACDGGWGQLPWQAVSTTGQTIVMPRWGYHNDAWQAVHTAVIQGEMRRTLIKLPPAVVLSAEDLGLPLVSPPRRLSARDAKIVWAVIMLTDQTGSLPEIDPTLLRIKKKRRCPKQSGVEAAQVALLADLPLKTCKRRLGILRKAGLLAYGRRRGWSLPVASGVPLPPGLPNLPMPKTETGEGEGPPSLGAIASALVAAISQLVDEEGGNWCGTPTALGRTLASQAEDAALRDWLRSGDRLGKGLRPLRPQLGEAGLSLAWGKSNGRRVIELTRD